MWTVDNEWEAIAAQDAAQDEWAWVPEWDGDEPDDADEAWMDAAYDFYADEA